MTKLNRLQKYLETGAEVTSAQIMSMFKLMNPTAAVHALRQRGVCVYANQKTLYSGQPVVKYRIGTPSKAIIAAAAAAGAFSK